MWSSYFDDFFSVEICDFSKHTDLVIASFFSILGWKLSAEKLVDYHTICKVLGVEFDPGMSGEGLSWVYNTGDRVDELCHQLGDIIQAGFLKRSEGERLRGRLQFACGQLFGRAARNHIRILSDHIKGCRSKLDDDTLHDSTCPKANQRADPRQPAQEALCQISRPTPLSARTRSQARSSTKI